MVPKITLAALCLLMPATLGDAQCRWVGGRLVCTAPTTYSAPAVTYSTPTSAVYTSGVTYQRQSYTTGGYYTHERRGLFGRRVVRVWHPPRTHTRLVAVASPVTYATETPAEKALGSGSDAACCPDHEARIEELEAEVRSLKSRITVLEAEQRSFGDIKPTLPDFSAYKPPLPEFFPQSETRLAQR